jgi:hypothetical protein
VARAGHRCEYCLIREQDTGFPLEVDHIISRKHGGDSIGRVTVRLLKLNAPERLAERRLLQESKAYPKQF